MSELRTEFEMERELPPAVNAAGELEDQSPEIVTYTAIWYVEGASGDGYNEPHTPAYPVVESVVDALGNDVSDDGDIMAAADDAVNAVFNMGCADGGDDFDPFDD